MAYDWLSDSRSAPYRGIIAQTSANTGVPQSAIANQIGAESSFNPNAISSTGAIGLTQTLASTGRDPGYGVTPYNPSDPSQAIPGMVAYTQARGGYNAAGLAAYSGGSYSPSVTQGILGGGGNVSNVGYSGGGSYDAANGTISNVPAGSQVLQMQTNGDETAYQNPDGTYNISGVGANSNLLGAAGGTPNAQSSAGMAGGFAAAGAGGAASSITDSVPLAITTGAVTQATATTAAANTEAGAVTGAAGSAIKAASSIASGFSSQFSGYFSRFLLVILGIIVIAIGLFMLAKNEIPMPTIKV